MKKVLSLFIAVVISTSALVGQDSDKKVRFGMKVAAIPTWLRSNDTKLYKSSATKFGFGFGLMLEFKITDVVKFSTGINGEFLGGEQTYIADYGYQLNGTAFVNADDPNWMNNYYTGTSYNYHKLNSRKIKTTYVSIPVSLKMMTKDYSGMRFFGMFGGDLAFLTKIKAYDEVLSHKTANSSQTNSDMNIYSETIPLRANLNVGLGMEYNISGSTALVISLNYMRSFTNLYKSTSKYTIKDYSTNMTNYIVGGANPGVSGAKQGAYVDGIAINIGILF